MGGGGGDIGASGILGSTGKSGESETPGVTPSVSLAGKARSEDSKLGTAVGATAAGGVPSPGREESPSSPTATGVSVSGMETGVGGTATGTGVATVAARSICVPSERHVISFP